MLIEFKVTNFRSIQDPQTLSLVANNDPSLEEINCFKSGLASVPKIVRSSALYGANASGKSNFILAMGMMKDIVINSAVRIREGDKFISITPFLFDPSSTKLPSEFEITYLEEGVRYQYGFAVNTNRIVKEWLLVYKSRKAQCWFERQYNDTTESYEWHFGSHLLDSQKHTLWKDSTRSNALFLSTAVNLNSDQLRPIYNWFYHKFIINLGGIPSPLGINVEYLKNPENKENFLKFLHAADLGITDIEYEYQKVKRIEFKHEFGGSTTIGTPQDEEIAMINFCHKGTDNKNVKIPFDHESHGTKKLSTYADPLLNVLKDGIVFVVDELESGFHPMMVKFILNLFHNNNLNIKNAQIIFSTHQTSLLNTDFLRRDQIWFMEKNEVDASVLYPLTDFNPRTSENIEKGYLQGRFGSIPFLGEMQF